MNVPSGFLWVVLTVYLEAAGEPAVGQKAVVKVILNRAQKNNWPLSSIVFARKQFSCWNAGINGTLREDGSRTTWIKSLKAFTVVFQNSVWAFNEWENGDRLQGATHYYAPQGMLDGKAPSWAASMTKVAQIDHHIFFRED